MLIISVVRNCIKNKEIVYKNFLHKTINRNNLINLHSLFYAFLNKTLNILFLLCVSLLCFCLMTKAQTVGLVLSGGGAKGYAHVGVIKALEEHGIPIDYVTGTSMGAIVAGLYASGYSPDEMVKIFNSDSFKNYYKGKIPSKYIDYFKYEQPDVSLLRVDLRRKSKKIALALPTNIIAPQPMDLGLVDLFARSSAYAGNNFDNLFVPFRCVAADVYNNREKVFAEGDLGTAVRASMTIPIMFKPVELDGTLYYDGGIYNNFPIETMREVFHPDIIIGVYVSAFGSSNPPESEDLFAQIESLVMGEQKSVDIDENKGLVLSFKFKDVGVMDFQKLDYVVNMGYDHCNEMIDSIKTLISRRKSLEELSEERRIYKESLPDLKFDSIIVDGNLKPAEKEDVERSLNLKRIMRHVKDSAMDFKTIESNYYKIISDYQLKFATPLAEYNDSTGKFNVRFRMKKDNRTSLGIGAVVSNGSSSMVYIGASYKLLGKVSGLFRANFYYGRFYASAMLSGRVDFPTYQPVAVDLSGTLNRYDFFKGSSRVLSMSYQPPYIIDYENNVRLDITTPITRHSIAKLGVATGEQKYSYFQVSSYQSSDTADITSFRYFTEHITFNYNTLNYIMYPTGGREFVVDARHVIGTERNNPGSTTALDDVYYMHHSWLQMNLIADHYSRIFKYLTIGAYAQLFVSNRPLFRNYSSSVLGAPAFAPIMNSKTLLLTNYRANNFFAIGVKPIFNITERLNLRTEFYFYMPFRKILKEELSSNIYTPIYSERFTYHYYMASAALVYNTRFGPLGISINYLDDDNVNWYFMFHLGFMMFNKKGLDY